MYSDKIILRTGYGKHATDPQEDDLFMSLFCDQYFYGYSEILSEDSNCNRGSNAEDASFPEEGLLFSQAIDWDEDPARMTCEKGFGGDDHVTHRNLSCLENVYDEGLPDMPTEVESEKTCGIENNEAEERETQINPCLSRDYLPNKKKSTNAIGSSRGRITKTRKCFSIRNPPPPSSRRYTSERILDISSGLMETPYSEIEKIIFNNHSVMGPFVVQNVPFWRTYIMKHKEVRGKGSSSLCTIMSCCSLYDTPYSLEVFKYLSGFCYIQKMSIESIQDILGGISRKEKVSKEYVDCLLEYCTMDLICTFVRESPFILGYLSSVSPLKVASIICDYIRKEKAYRRVNYYQEFIREQNEIIPFLSCEAADILIREGFRIMNDAL